MKIFRVLSIFLRGNLLLYYEKVFGVILFDAYPFFAFGCSREFDEWFE